MHLRNSYVNEKSTEMNFKYTIKTAIAGLLGNKTRSALTVLGIVIGVAAIIVVMSVGQGAQRLIVGEIASLGSRVVAIQPGAPEDFGVFLGLNILSEEDLRALSNSGRVPNAEEIMPMVAIFGAVAKKGDDQFQVQGIGGEARFITRTFDIHPSVGTIFTEDQVDGKAKVAIIGQDVKEELFGPGRAVGNTIELKDTTLRVVGVFPEIGRKAFLNVDKAVIFPWTTAQTYMTGDKYFSQIIVKADKEQNVDKMVYDITQTLREVNDVGPDEDDPFTVRTPEALIDQISLITDILTSFLIAVVAISLVVGGVGISNIMLVSVTERTSEIGLRKALGATHRDIRRQFLYEAVILTAFGGMVGVAIGSLVSFVAALVLSATIAEGWAFVFPVMGAIIGVGVSAGVGLIFGIYPAIQASKKSPIEALRYE